MQALAPLADAILVEVRRHPTKKWRFHKKPYPLPALKWWAFFFAAQPFVMTSILYVLILAEP